MAQDSPLFQLFDDFPGIDLSHALTGVFRNRVAYAEQLRARLAEARALEPRERAVQELEALLRSHGDNAETLGLLGRIYKDRYKAAETAQPGSPTA